MGVAHRHQLLPQLTGDAVVTGFRRFRDQQGDMEGRGWDGFKEVRALRKHGGGGFLQRDGSLQRDGALQFLVHDAIHKLFHELPAVQFVIVARPAAADLVHCEEPFSIRDEQRLRQEALMLDKSRLANQSRHRVDAAIRFGVLFPEGRVLSLDACCLVSCFFGRFRCGFCRGFGRRF